MAAGRKRKNQYGLKQDDRGTWHCDFSVAGTRVQRSTYTKDRAAAEEWCAKVASDLWRQVKLGEKPSLLWHEAVELWFKAKQADRKKDLANDADKARILAPLLDGRKIHELETTDLDGVLDGLTAKRALANGTRNRYRSFIVGVLNYAKKKGYAVGDVHPEKRREPKEKVVWITKDDARRLLAELAERPHLRRMIEFSLATGLRQSNVTGLEWARVDLKRRIAWVDPEDAKGGEPIPVPLSDEAAAILIEARNCTDHGHERLCFTYFGNYIAEPANTAWDKALKRATIREDFTWHCLRHTWASWHVMGLMHPEGVPTPLEVLQKLGGWSSYAMVQKYAHLAPDYKARFAGNTGLREQPAKVIPIGAAA